MFGFCFHVSYICVNKTEMMETGALQLLIQRFNKIKPEITPEDRKEAQQTLDMSQVTIHRYMNGIIGKNVDKALALYEFFQGRINERVERIKAIA